MQVLIGKLRETVTDLNGNQFVTTSESPIANESSLG